MGKDYVAFIAGLPEIFRNDKKQSLSVHDFREQAEFHLKSRDKKWFDMLFLSNDNQQVLRLLNKQESNRKLECVYPLSVLEEEVREPENRLPHYLNNFIIGHKEGHSEYIQRSENVLNRLYYGYMRISGNSFLVAYMDFLMNLKNLSVALNCRKHRKHIAEEIVGENEFSQKLLSSHAKDFGLSVEYPWVEKVVSLMESKELVKREQEIDQIKWDYIEENTKFHYFSIERVLGFALELMIVERWSKMDSEAGRQVFKQIVEKFKTNPVIVKQYE